MQVVPVNRAHYIAGLVIPQGDANDSGSYAAGSSSNGDRARFYGRRYTMSQIVRRLVTREQGIDLGQRLIIQFACGQAGEINILLSHGRP